jgi:hypothetical protein
MTFWCGSNPDSDLDPAIFVIDLQDANKKLIKKKFFCLLLFEGTFTSFFKDKKIQKKSQNSKNQGFSYYFCLMIEGSGAGSGSGHIPLTSDPDLVGTKTCGSGGSGSRTLKKINL